MRKGKAARGAWARAVACLLLVLIGADLAADTSCDLAPAAVGGVGFVLLAASSGDDVSGEACRDVCVPDCFCCCRSLAAGLAVAPAPPEPLATVLSCARVHGLAGVRPVVDHPPLVLA